MAVSEYRDPKLAQLRAPAADADRLASVLGDPGIGNFDVVVLHDPEERDLRRQLATFFGVDRRPDDVLLVHFSCHGVKDEGGELYFAAADTELGDLLGATGIASSWLEQQISRSRSRRILVLLDCCFSGSFPFGMRARAGEDVNVPEHLGGRGRAVITASSSMEYAYEGDELSGKGQASIFSAAVTEALETGKADRDQDHLISVDELYDYVYERVEEQTPAQRPNKMSNLEGPFYVARSTYEAPVEPAKLDDQLLHLTESGFAGARLGAVEELSRLLRSRDPRVVLAARQQLVHMLGDDSRRVSARAKEVLAEVPAPAAADEIPPPRSEEPSEASERGSTDRSDARETVIPPPGEPREQWISQRLAQAAAKLDDGLSSAELSALKDALSVYEPGRPEELLGICRMATPAAPPSSSALLLTSERMVWTNTAASATTTSTLRWEDIRSAEHVRVPSGEERVRVTDKAGYSHAFANPSGRGVRLSNEEVTFSAHGLAELAGSRASVALEGDP